MRQDDDPSGGQAAEPAVPFPLGPVMDRYTVEGWTAWRLARNSFTPARVMAVGEYKKLSPRQQYRYDLHRIATHSNLPIQDTPMSASVEQVMRWRIGANAPKSTERTRPGLMINGAGQQGKTETACKCAADFEDEWLQAVGYLNPDAVPGTRDLLVPVANVQTPVEARPATMCEAILDFYGEDYKGMNPATLKRTVKRALKDHATKALIMDDITRLKMHRERDQDVLDFIRDLMSFTVVVLIGVGIPKSGLLREGRQDPRTGDWLFPPVRDKGKSPNDEAATQTERRFKLVNLDPFSYDTPAGIAAWVEHLKGIEDRLRLFHAGPEPLTGGTMPEYLFRRTEGIVGKLSSLIEEGCMAAMDTGTEDLTEDLLDEVALDGGTLPDHAPAAGEAPDAPGPRPVPDKGTRRKKGRNTVFDDHGDAPPAWA